MSLRFPLLIFMVLQLVFNTMHRMVYPFLAVFARGLGVEISTLSLVVTGRSFVGRTEIGALLATFIYRQFGFLPVTLIAVLFNVFALLALGELTQKVVSVRRILAWFRQTEGSET